MPHFSKRIDSRYGKTDFLFTRIFTDNGPRYYIAVIDKQGKTIAFNMEENGEGWRIIDAPKIPEWVMQLEKELSNEIHSKEVG